MKTYLRLLTFARPIGKFAFPYLLTSVLAVVFGLINLTLLIPILDVLFGRAEQSAQMVPAAEPVFSFSESYFKNLFNWYVAKMIREDGAIGALKFVSLTLVFCVFFANLFRYISTVLVENLRQNLIKKLRTSLFNKVSEMHLGYFTNSRKGDIVARIMSDVAEVEFSITTTLNVVVKEPLTIIVCFYLLLKISPSLTLFTLLLLPVSGGIIGTITRKLKKQALAVQESIGRIYSIVDETLSSMRVIYAFNGVNYVRRKFLNENEFFTNTNKSMARRREAASPFSEFMGAIIVAGILLYGGSLVLSPNPELSASAFIAYIVMFTQLLRPAKALSQAFLNVQKGLAAGGRIFEILDAETEIKDKPDAQPLSQFEEGVEFKNVTFSYSGNPVLKDVSFKLPYGKMLALVGPSGAGKSTIADLIPRFYDADSGEILIDGKNVKDLQQDSIRQFMGVVTQESILYNDTIFENIAFGDPNATIEKVMKAAKVANAHDFITASPDGYNTIIGDRGNKLSGGQRQRLNIARAVYKNPAILILDEATSALDTESEKLVQEALMQLMANRTSLVIAHRLSTVRHADLILVLEDGKIVESGNHDSLMVSEVGLYKKLYELQQYGNKHNSL